MKIQNIALLLILGLMYNFVSAQKSSDANIIGHVVNNGEHLPFVNIVINGTTIGTATDVTGHFQMINVPTGEVGVVASCLGYKTKEIKVSTEANKTVEVNFDLEEDALGLDEVVVTGNRFAQKRTEAPVLVNTITPKLFAVTQSGAVGEGLNFTPGMRMETNCSNCGFTQIRMNGMEGPYSQILINSRPIFSGLAGVYGLELIPSNMIDKVEVVRGGGSALYGGNAIAGTINIILKDPITNSYEFGVSTGAVGLGMDGAGSPASEYAVNMNTSFVSDDYKNGLSLYGFYRNRDHFDANDDGYSELSEITNTTIGARYYHRFGNRSKLTMDMFHINEDRRGGSDFDKPNHEASISEALKHNITTGALSYDMFLRENDMLTVYTSAQMVDRDAYYGAGQSLADYGKSVDFTYNSGVQYKTQFGNSKVVLGVENTGGMLEDKKLGYADYDNAYFNNDGELVIPHTENTMVADQTTNTTGIFAQYEIKKGIFKATVGARYDSYVIEDLEHESEKKTGNVFSPRLTLMADVMENLQARVSYSTGYRAPQIFDEDLHIETSGSRKVVHTNDPDLKEESSQSYMTSLDYNKKIGNVQFSILAEGFATILTDPFANEYGEMDENGVVEYTRINADGHATVKGVNLELNLVPSKMINFKSGFTLQSSEYSEAQEFDEKRFFRTPDQYGYLTMVVNASKNFEISLTGNYTGDMLVPHFGVDADTDDPAEMEALANADIIAGERLEESDPFFDMGLKLAYYLRMNKGTEMQIYAGVKNMFNSYQDDFDSSELRDPGFIYGPAAPRTITFGVKVGNMLR